MCSTKSRTLTTGPIHQVNVVLYFSIVFSINFHVMARGLYRLVVHEGVCISDCQVQRLITIMILLFAAPKMHAYQGDCAVVTYQSLNAFHQCRSKALHNNHRFDVHFENHHSSNSRQAFDSHQHDTLQAQGPTSWRHTYKNNLGRQFHIRGSRLLERTSSRSQQEVHDLISFKASISADPLKALSGWTANASTPCSWVGIYCSSDGRHVVAVDLHGHQLAGHIGSALRALSRLQSLEQVNLSANFFIGSLLGSALANFSSLSYLNLSANYISGALPPQLEGLLNLETLDLQRNNLSGEIPTSICNCTRLKSLNLGTNMLTGSIPEGIGRLSSLELLNLGTFIPDLQTSAPDENGNSFSGIIPYSLWNCTSLRTLSLQDNPALGGETQNLLNLDKLMSLQVLNLTSCNFWGYIPAWIGNLTDLRIINLSYNNFHGHIPTSIGSLRKLSVLSLSHNNISGTIPPSILNCTSLTVLLLQENALLTGQIPSNLGLLSKLTWFAMWSTVVTGVLPASLSNCSAMEYIAFGNNKLMDPQPMPAWLGSMANLLRLFLNDAKLYGPIPKEMGRLTKLEQLSIYSNFLTESVPSELGNCTSLSLAQIGGNPLTGHLPPKLGYLPKLQKFSVAYSYMSGHLPTSLSNLTKIEVFDVSWCNFGGTIDSYWGSLPQLISLQLNSNKFTGSVPSTLGNSTTLQKVDFSANRLTGEIPPSLGNLTSLHELKLAENKIRGTVPSELASVSNLVTLDLRFNSLQGSIPSNIGDLFGLQNLYLSANNLSGPIPESLINCSRMLMLDLSHNQFNGSIPGDIISRIVSLTFLNLSNNQFSGSWPLQLSSLAYIQEINTSWNSLSGSFIAGFDGDANRGTETLPSYDSNWKSLVKLDISLNNFTGVIPESLGSLPLLSFFNASYNNFQGPIPNLNLTAASFLGNPLLCGAILGRGQECRASSAGLSRSCQGFHCRPVWIPTICSAILLAGLLVLATWFLVRAVRAKRSIQKKKMCMQDFNLTFDPAIKFSTDDVLRVIHENDTIAEGPVNVVYKGMVSEGKTFAVKVLSERQHEVAESEQGNSISRQSKVLHEVRIMANLRHRNILRVVGYCTHAETRAIILEYMPEGNLWQHLHGLGDGSCRLSWQRRVNIALGVAEGMKYLHHDFPEPLIHGDLKPSNILLDSQFLPKVADFGLSKFATPHREDQATASAIYGTIGYIPPEYALEPVVSTKGDVYSYGIILLELLSGRSPTSESSMTFDPGVDYRSWAVANYYQDPVSLVDRALRDESLIDHKVSEQTRLMLLLALLCTREMPQSRPTMHDALKMLVDISEIRMKPIERRSIRELAHDPPDRRYGPFSCWSEEDPNGTASPSLSLGHADRDEGT